MYKLRTKDGVYFFQSLDDLFWYIVANENLVLASDDDFVKIYFINKDGKK